VVVEREMKETKEDHSQEWKEKSAQKGFDRADIVRDVRLADLPGPSTNRRLSR
jgi:hypothetical protein